MHSVKLFMMGITLIVIVVGVPFLLFGWLVVIGGKK